MAAFNCKLTLCFDVKLGQCHWLLLARKSALYISKM